MGFHLISDCNLDGDTLSNNGDEKKKSKIWRHYRDAKSLKEKYKRELRRNGDRIAAIIDNCKFTVDTFTKLRDIAKSNEFKLKDEDYFKDSDDELEQQKQEILECPKEDEEENEFNPLREFKLEQ